MNVFSYEADGVTLWGASIHKRSSRNRKVRAQRERTGFKTREEAETEWKKLFQWACSYIARRENDGLTWAEVINSWEEWYERYPSSRWDKSTVRDYIAICNNWTAEWLKRPAGALTVTDGFQMIEEARQAGASTQRLYQIKTTVNVIYKWAMGAGKILNKDHSPVFGIELKKKDSDGACEILKQDEVADLLGRAEDCEHDWFPIWITAAYTGLRSSELEGLRKPDIDLIPIEEAKILDLKPDTVKKNYGLIRVSRQWKKIEKDYGDLKGRYWRTVPVSGKLYWFLIDYLKNDFGCDAHGERLFPVLSEHRRGEQAKVLKTFCASQGLKEIKFHTFRACFATHLLAQNVPEIAVMKIGGWRDRETMMMYIRRSGVDEMGATEKLDFSRPQAPLQPAVGHENVVSIFSKRT